MLKAITVAASLLCINSFAYDPTDLEQLKRTNNCIECDLSGANLVGMKLIKANLSGSLLYGANLAKVDFAGANLDNADLYTANLGEANLEYANLSNSDLRRANLGGANLYGANLYGTVISTPRNESDTLLRAKNYKRP